MALAREARGDAKSGELNAASGGVDEHIGRLEILVNQPTSVELPDCAGQRRGDSEELLRSPSAAGRGDREARRLCSRPRACVCPRSRTQFQWPQCPGTVQIALKFVFVREAIDALEGRMFSAGRDGYERVRLAAQRHPAIVCRRHGRRLATAPPASRLPNQPRTRRMPSSVPLLLPSDSRLGPGARRCREDQASTVAINRGIL